MSAELQPLASRLTEWFRLHGRDALLEIEGRLRGPLSQSEFNYILRRLGSFTGWAAPPAEATTVDVRYYSGLRATLPYDDSGAEGSAAAPPPPPPPQFCAKQTLETADLSCGDGQSLRLALCAEDAAAAPRPGDAVDCYRVKARTRFALAGGLAFDLTRVRSGPTLAAARAAPPTHEVELEWCGQRRPDLPPPAALAQDFLFKMEDVLGFKRRAVALSAAAATAAAAAPAAAAPAPAGGATQAAPR